MNYLHDIIHSVVIKGQMSYWQYINARLPQGSVLGPLLFLIHLNDIVDDILSNISLLADDTSLYRPIDSTDDINRLNTDLDTISNWLSDVW